MIGAGVTLRLRAVQVIQYVEGTVGASKFGFDEEEGFTVEEQVPASETSPAAAAEEVQTELPLEQAKVAQIKPVQQAKPKPVEEPKASTTVSGADELAAEIAQLVGNTNGDG